MDKSRKVKIGIGAGAAVVILGIAGSVLLGNGGGQAAGGPGGARGGPGGGQQATATVVKAAHPYTGDISLTTGLTGTVEPSDVVYVYAKASGDVTSVLVKAGDYVTQGQVLCEIDTETVEAARNSMDSAAVSLSEAQSSLRRMEILYASGDLSQQEYEQYANKVKSAQLQYDSAKLNYDRQVEYSTITAPIDGRIESCDIEVHDRVSQNAQLCVITGEGQKRVSFYVTERMMQNISTGDELDIQKGGTTYKARISEISSMVDSDTGLFKVKAELEEADRIATGSTVKLNLVTSHVEDVLMVPVDAIYYSGGDGYVYVYNDGIANMTGVEVGLYDSENAEIKSGITEDTMVVSTWSSNLYEGARVQLRTDEEAPAGAENAGEAPSGAEEAGEAPAGEMPAGAVTGGPAAGESPEAGVNHSQEQKAQ